MSGGSPPPPAPPSPPKHAHPHTHNVHLQTTRLNHSQNQNYQTGFTAMVYQPPSLHEVDDPNVSFIDEHSN